MLRYLLVLSLDTGLQWCKTDELRLAGAIYSELAIALGVEKDKVLDIIISNH